MTLEDTRTSLIEDVEFLYDWEGIPKSKEIDELELEIFRTTPFLHVSAKRK